MISGSIYKIGSKKGPVCYVGSTTGNVDHRFMVHKCYYFKNYHGGNLSSKKVFDSYGVNNCKITVVEKKKFESKDAMRKREAEIVKELKAVNKRVPFIKNCC